jgi:peptidoglycan pentaglycine glycine transferase (the first glycine)
LYHYGEEISGGVFLVGDYILYAIPSERRTEWDTFVAEHASGHLLQCWNWGELKAGSLWQPLRVALLERETGKMLAAAQVLRRTAARIPPSLGHLAYVPRGPVLDWTALADDGTSLAALFLGRLRSYLRFRGALALQIEPPLEAESVEAKAALSALHDLHFMQIQSVQPLRTITLDVQPAEETLLAQMKEKWRYNVRLAGRKGVEIRVAQTLAELDAWYTLLQTTGERDQFGIHTLEYYRRAWQLLPARLFLAYADTELLAGIFVGLFGKEAIYLYGASSNARRNLMPNYLLQWEAIRWARSCGARSYDFWGIPATDDEDAEMAGVYRFKSGWGGRVVRFVGNYEYVYHPLAIRVARSFLD